MFSAGGVTTLLFETTGQRLGKANCLVVYETKSDDNDRHMKRERLCWTSQSHVLCYRPLPVWCWPGHHTAVQGDLGGGPRLR